MEQQLSVAHNSMLGLPTALLGHAFVSFSKWPHQQVFVYVNDQHTLYFVGNSDIAGFYKQVGLTVHVSQHMVPGYITMHAFAWFQFRLYVLR